jgi:multidrug efflux pump subunit AcrB
VVTTILTTFVAFSPLFFMPGMLGKFVYVIPLVIALALLISLVESSLALPAHLAAGLAKMKRAKNGLQRTGFDTDRRIYKKAVQPFFRYLSGLLFIAA